MSVNPPGTNGMRAAQQFKAVPENRRHATAVQYTPNFQAPGASNDLFA